MGHFRLGVVPRTVAVAAAVAVAVLCVACGAAPPEQVATTTVTARPTSTPIPSQTVVVTVTPSVIPAPSPTPGPSPTPNTQATSFSVFATITALAATPTYPPTSTPRPFRTPISAGPGQNDIPPTALFTSDGIGILTLSRQVLPGGAAALTIKTKPTAVCTLKVDRSTADSPRSEAIPGAATHVAGRDGSVAWIWNIDASEPAGIMRLKADCGIAGVAQLQLKVVK